MRRQLPPLSSLVAFSIASRHLSFSKAADELHLTQSAVSRQISSLEALLGAPLFVRLTRRIELTDFGRDYLLEVESALAALEQATEYAIANAQRRLLTVDALPTVATHWLMPRLADFSRRYPDIELNLITSTGPVGFPDTRLHAALRVGSLPGRDHSGSHRHTRGMVRDWRGVIAEPLFHDVLIPVCAPALIEGRTIAAPQDLLDLPRIHTTNRIHAWQDWFQAHGLEDTDTVHHFRYRHFFLSLAAAKAGEGVALIPHFLLQDEPAEALVRLFSPWESKAGDYHLLVLDKHRERPEFQAFRSWLQEQVAQMPPSLRCKSTPRSPFDTHSDYAGMDA